MSAFVVSRGHVAAIVAYAVSEGVIARADACAVADTLMHANIASVNYRYQERNEPEPPFTASELHSSKLLTPTEALKACHCLDYQSCEPPAWEGSEPDKLLKRIIAHALGAGATSFNTRAYEAAAWCID